MKAILCYCTEEFAKDVEKILTQSGLRVSYRINSIVDSTIAKRQIGGQLLDVKDFKHKIVVSVAENLDTVAREFGFKITIYVPSPWLFFLRQKDPRLELAKKIRGILHEYGKSKVFFLDLI